MNDRIGRVVKYDDIRAFGFIKEIGGLGTQQFFSINGVKDRTVLWIGDLVSFRVIDSTVKPGRTEATDVVLKVRHKEKLSTIQALRTFEEAEKPANDVVDDVVDEDDSVELLDEALEKIRVIREQLFICQENEDRLG